MNLTQKGEISDISSHQSTIWASASDCKVYEFDTRMIRQKKEISHFLECKDEISQIAYDNKCNSLFIGDDHGKVTKYSLTDKKITESICFHDNALCTSVTVIPSFEIGFCGGTDAMLYQFKSSNLENAFSYSMQDLITNSQKNKQNNKLMVNPPFIYSLDSKVLKDTEDCKQAAIAIALGNGTVALYAPIIGNEDTDKENKQNDDDNDGDIVNDPVCCKEMHQSAVSDMLSFSSIYCVTDIIHH